MWDPDKWFRGSVVCQLLDESRLQARERIDRLGQQIDRFVDDQEPGVVDKNLDGFGIGHLENRERIASRCLQLRDDRATIAPSGQKKTRNTGHETNMSVCYVSLVLLVDLMFEQNGARVNRDSRSRCNEVRENF